jgi:hypothetical protein
MHDKTFGKRRTMVPFKSLSRLGGLRKTIKRQYSIAYASRIPFFSVPWFYEPRSFVSVHTKLGKSPRVTAHSQLQHMSV